MTRKFFLAGILGVVVTAWSDIARTEIKKHPVGDAKMAGASSGLCVAPGLTVGRVPGLRAVRVEQNSELCRFEVEGIAETQIVLSKNSASSSLAAGVAAIKQALVDKFEAAGVAARFKDVEGDIGDSPAQGFIAAVGEGEGGLVVVCFITLHRGVYYMLIGQGGAESGGALGDAMDALTEAISFGSDQAQVDRASPGERSAEKHPDGETERPTPAEGSSRLEVHAAGVSIDLPEGFLAQPMAELASGGVSIARSDKHPGVVITGAGMPRMGNTATLVEQTMAQLRASGATVKRESFRVGKKSAPGYSAMGVAGPDGSGPQFQQMVVIDNGDALVLLSMSGPQTKQKQLVPLFKQVLAASSIEHARIDKAAMLVGKFCVEPSYHWTFDGHGGVSEYHESHGYNRYTGSIFMGGGTKEGRYQIEGDIIRVQFKSVSRTCRLSADGRTLTCDHTVLSKNEC